MSKSNIQKECLECNMSSSCYDSSEQNLDSNLDLNKRRIVYRKGENVYKQGAFISHIAYVLDGLVKLYLECDNGKKINIRILNPGKYIGLQSILEHNYSIITAVALKDTTVCLIEREYFLSSVKKNTNGALDIVGKIFEIDNTLNVLKRLGSKQMHGRVADTLLYLSDPKFDNDDIFKHITRKDIAEFAGISTEGVIRILSEFKSSKLIDITGRTINILDKEKLKDISIKN